MTVSGRSKTVDHDGDFDCGGSVNGGGSGVRGGQIPFLIIMNQITSLEESRLTIHSLNSLLYPGGRQSPAGATGRAPMSRCATFDCISTVDRRRASLKRREIRFVKT